MQKNQHISPIMSKLGEFLVSKRMKHMLNQPHSKLDFTELMNEGKILLCDLSHGKIGEDQSAFLGGLLISEIQLAAFKRAEVKETDRKDFYMYVDEFQNFASPSFAQMVSGVRKYRVNLIVTHQTISQIDEENITKVILANVGTVISFGTGSPDDEEKIRPIFEPQVKRHELQNLSAYTFYMKNRALHPTDAFSGEVDNYDVPENEELVQKIIEHSRKTYATPLAELIQAENRRNITHSPKKTKSQKHNKDTEELEGNEKLK